MLLLRRQIDRIIITPWLVRVIFHPNRMIDDFIMKCSDHVGDAALWTLPRVSQITSELSNWCVACPQPSTCPRVNHCACSETLNLRITEQTGGTLNPYKLPSKVPDFEWSLKFGFQSNRTFLKHGLLEFLHSDASRRCWTQTCAWTLGVSVSSIPAVSISLLLCWWHKADLALILNISYWILLCDTLSCFVLGWFVCQGIRGNQFSSVSLKKSLSFWEVLPSRLVTKGDLFGVAEQECSSGNAELQISFHCEFW